MLYATQYIYQNISSLIYTKEFKRRSFLMLRKSFGLLFSLLFVSSFVFGQTIPSGYKMVKELGGMSEYKLESNGLSVILMEDHSAPVITFMVTYHVGSRNEVTGTTGSTHLLEHLMFKDTKKYQKKNHNKIDDLLSSIGAISNASTWYDRTNYHETMASDQLELGVQIESERMRNLLLREEDKNSEMTVVRNEYERGENSPFEALDVLIKATAFTAHPYHHPTIGWRSDIENVPIQKLRDFYNTFYWPNNATVTVIGDLDKTNALTLIKKYYGEITSSPNPIPQVYTTEPEQQGLRRVVVKRPGQLGVVGVSDKIPEGLSKDTYPLTVLNYILSDGKTSRYYKSLTDKNLAVNYFVYYVPFRDASLFTPYVFLTPGVKHEDVEKIIVDEYEKIKKEGVTQDEVTRAINKIIAETAYGRDGSYSVASQINEAIAMGDWSYFATYEDNIKKVTAQDVQNVVKKYFNTDTRTIGYFYPQIPGGSEGNTKGSQMRSKNPGIGYYRDPSLYRTNSAVHSELSNDQANELTYDAGSVPNTIETAKISDNITRKRINGIDVITAQTGVKDVITFTGSFAAGDVFNPETNSMIADLTGNMLDKGTTKNDKFALAKKLEDLGASISFSVGSNALNFSGKLLRKDLSIVIGLLAEQLRMPLFSTDELDKLKKQRSGNFHESMDDPSSVADNTLSQLLFPKGHPNYQAPLQQAIDDINKVTIEDIKSFYNKYYGPKSMVFAAAGDIDNKELGNAIESSFKDWKGGVDYPSYKNAEIKSSFVNKFISMPGKTSTVLDLGLVVNLKRTDPDYYPLMFGVDVFGGGTFMARLMSIVRDDEGLTYGIYSWLSKDIFCGGQWNVQGTFAPQLLAKGTESTMRELKRWVKDGITEAEMKNTKSRLIGEYKVQLATTSGLVNQILSIVQRGLDVGFIDKYPDIINALTLNQVSDAIKKYINPDKVVTVVAGSVDDKGNPLK
jgi:zinc protease